MIKVFKNERCQCPLFGQTSLDRPHKILSLPPPRHFRHQPRHLIKSGPRLIPPPYHRQRATPAVRAFRRGAVLALTNPHTLQRPLPVPSLLGASGRSQSCCSIASGRIDAEGGLKCLSRPDHIPEAATGAAQTQLPLDAIRLAFYCPFK